MGKFILFVLVFFRVLLINVEAKEIIYVNKKGLELKAQEYQNILTIHGEEYFDNMTLNDFLHYQEYYSASNLKIKKIELPTNFVMPNSNFLDTNYKTLSIYNVTNHSSIPFIVINLEWKKIPNIKSYDVIGVRLWHTHFSSPVTTYALIDGIRVSPTKIKQKSNGIGVSIKLPSNSSSIFIQQSFTVNTGGTIYASYQHSKKNISLGDSQNFIISTGGLGKVFQFHNNTLFDQMDGIVLKV